jgi:hypothetical protein
MRLWKDTIAHSSTNASWCMIPGPKRRCERPMRPLCTIPSTNAPIKRACGHQPPRVAFADLPSLPKVADLVDPDAWLRQVDGQHFVRKIQPNGSILLETVRYYVKQALAGQYVDLSIDAQQRELMVWSQGRPLRRLAIKGLYGKLMSFEEDVAGDGTGGIGRATSARTSPLARTDRAPISLKPSREDSSSTSEDQWRCL